MAITELKEAINLLTRLPSLWIPGIVGGILTAALWLTLNLSGTFFARQAAGDLRFGAAPFHYWSSGDNQEQ